MGGIHHDHAITRAQSCVHRPKEPAQHSLPTQARAKISPNRWGRCAGKGACAGPTTVAPSSLRDRILPSPAPPTVSALAIK
jgi:hypothetical protein